MQPGMAAPKSSFSGAAEVVRAPDEVLNDIFDAFPVGVGLF